MCGIPIPFSVRVQTGSLFHFLFFIEQSTIGKRPNNPFLFSKGKVRNRITSRYSFFVFQLKNKETDNESLFHFCFPICNGKTIGRFLHGPFSCVILIFSWLNHLHIIHRILHTNSCIHILIGSLS